MTAPAVVAAFEARLAAEWSRCPIIGENLQGRTPKDGSPFLIVQWPFVTREQITFGTPGANTFREAGAARLVLNVRSGDGLAEGRQWADELVRIFIGRDLGGVIVRAVDGPVTDDRNENGNYYLLAVAVAYEFDFTA